MVFLIYNIIVLFVLFPFVIFTKEISPKKDNFKKKTMELQIKEELNKNIEAQQNLKKTIKNNKKKITTDPLPVKQYKSLTELIIDIFSNIDFKDSKVSFSLLDPNSNLIASINKDLNLNQASVSKLIVSLAAIKYLGLNYRFKTNFYADAEIDNNGVLDGNLIVKGFGDPNLLSQDIYKIINFLKMIGLKEIKGNIIIDLSFFDRQYSIYNLKEEDDSRSYAAFNNALPLNYNSFKFTVKPYIDEENEENNKVNINISYPASLIIKLKNKLTLSDRYSRIKAETSKAKYYHNTKLELKGRVNKKINLLFFYRKIHNPDYYFAKIFFKMLKYSKIKIKGRLKIKYTDQIKNKRTVSLLYSYQTRYLLDTLIVMNRYSNNFIAEQLLKIVGAEYSKTKEKEGIASWEDGINAVKEMLKNDIKIDPANYKYSNASGLNDANFFSSYQIAKILYYVKNNFNYKWYLLSTLPKIGVSGTLRRYCMTEDCKGAVIAKTGSLRTTVALAGFINVKNKLYTFSLAINFNSSKKKFRKILKKAKELISNLTSLENL